MDGLKQRSPMMDETSKSATKAGGNIQTLRTKVSKWVVRGPGSSSSVTAMNRDIQSRTSHLLGMSMHEKRLLRLFADRIARATYIKIVNWLLQAFHTSLSLM